MATGSYHQLQKSRLLLRRPLLFVCRSRGPLADAAATFDVIPAFTLKSGLASFRLSTLGQTRTRCHMLLAFVGLVRRSARRSVALRHAVPIRPFAVRLPIGFARAVASLVALVDSVPCCAHISATLRDKTRPVAFPSLPFDPTSS